MADRYAVVGNFTSATSTASEGTKVFLQIALGDSRFQVRYKSRSGRWITKVEDGQHLGNWRQITVPPEHRMYGDADPAPRSHLPQAQETHRG